MTAKTIEELAEADDADPGDLQAALCEANGQLAALRAQVETLTAERDAAHVTLTGVLDAIEGTRTERDEARAETQALGYLDEAARDIRGRECK